MREDGRDLRRHGVGRVSEVGTDEDFKMPVRAAPIVPALADRLALRAPAGEADRDAHARGQGGIQRLEQWGHARCHPVEPAFAVVLRHAFYSLQIALRGDGLSPSLPSSRGAAGERGGQRESTGWSGRSAARHGPSIPVAGERRPGTPFPLNEYPRRQRRHRRPGALPASREDRHADAPRPLAGLVGAVRRR